MKYSDWQALKNLFKERKMFSLKDFMMFCKFYLKYKEDSAHVILHRAVEQGILWRLCKGWYGFRDDLPSPDEVVLTVLSPCYISLERALSLSGIISQGIFVITVMTPLAWKSKGSLVIEYPEEYSRKYMKSEFLVEVHATRRIEPEYLNDFAPDEVALADLLLVRGVIEKEWRYLSGVLSELSWDEIDFKRLESEIEKLFSLYRNDYKTKVVNFVNKILEECERDIYSCLPDQPVRLFASPKEPNFYKTQSSEN